MKQVVKSKAACLMAIFLTMGAVSAYTETAVANPALSSAVDFTQDIAANRAAADMGEPSWARCQRSPATRRCA